MEPQLVLNMTTINNSLQEGISSYLNPGYKIDMMLDQSSDRIIIRVRNSSTTVYQRMSIANEFIYRNLKAPDKIMDYILSCLDNNLIHGWIPKYERNFNGLMKSILNLDIEKGKLWASKS